MNRVGTRLSLGEIVKCNSLAVCRCVSLSSLLFLQSAIWFTSSNVSKEASFRVPSSAVSIQWWRTRANTQRVQITGNSNSSNSVNLRLSSSRCHNMQFHRERSRTIGWPISSRSHSDSVRINSQPLYWKSIYIMYWLVTLWKSGQILPCPPLLAFDWE